MHHGAAEGRDPNRFFDGAWYLAHYPDVASTGQLPLLHYLQTGAAELRNPHPRFDAAHYAEQHPEAAANPLLFHLRVGVVRGWLTEKPIAIKDYLPANAELPSPPHNVAIDVIIPAYRGLAQTQRCIRSVLADPDRPTGRVIVVDDRSPEPKLSAWLDRLDAKGRIELVRNRRNLGFVASANIGIGTAGNHDVVLLNSDTEVPPGWLTRLAGHAYASPRVASVSPFSNNATICGYPRIEAGPPAFGLGTAELDAACRAANGGRSVEVPTTVGFCMYIRRAALADVGLFDTAAFGRGYGEENDFCLRAGARGWRHLLACDTFVYHEGGVSFGAGASAAASHAQDVLAERYPHYTRLVAQHVKLDAAGPFRIAVTMQLFRRSGLPTILMLTHDMGGGVRRHIGELVTRTSGKANCLLLESTARGARTFRARAAGPSRADAACRTAGRSCLGAAVGQGHARAYPSSDEHGSRRSVPAAPARCAVRRHGARLFCDLPAGQPAAVDAGCLLRRAGARILQCVHRRSPQSRLARYRVLAARQCLAVPRGGSRDLPERGRAQASGALRIRCPRDRCAARTGGGRTVAARSASVRQEPQIACGGDRCARQSEGCARRDDHGRGGRSC